LIQSNFPRYDALKTGRHDRKLYTEHLICLNERFKILIFFVCFFNNREAKKEVEFFTSSFLILLKNNLEDFKIH